MNRKEEFINSGFKVVETIADNKLLNFLKENYPTLIRDNEININELKALAGLPVDEKVNGYGLNFVGRNFARAKYAQKTEKEVKVNQTLSKNFDTTQNLVLKGDNLESLKILKSHYTEKIKCIYIDPPYNTTSDQFVYPDKFDKEETEVLGIYNNLSEDDFARMDFSFKSKKSHSGWLAFIYPRLLLARDLLSKDGVIFISIDDNEQANLKLLCDEIFGEENFVANIVWHKKYGASNDSKYFSEVHDHILLYGKCKENWLPNLFERPSELNAKYKNLDNDERGEWIATNLSVKTYSKANDYTITGPNGDNFIPPPTRSWVVSEKKYFELLKDNRITFGKDGKSRPYLKTFLSEVQNGIVPTTIWNYNEAGHNIGAKSELRDLFIGSTVPFDTPKPTKLINRILQVSTSPNDIILDFFAGSGTTGHAVMQLNAEDGGNRKFILCQIDEPIGQDKPAYQFCLENNLPPVISSITIERLKRAGEKIASQIEEENNKTGLFEENKKQIPDVGFKVFDSAEAPKLEMKDGMIVFPEANTDTHSRIYNMIFTVGLDEPTQTPEVVVEDAIYKIGKNYYITNSEKVNSSDFSNAIKDGKVFIDGWTASLNATLQLYKEDVKIVF
ncbi:site-specific DNA-methyltransferase [Flavobacterium aestuarii]|uniref:site-specific DNA-methyltransferase n=1 Tax=Flavobacterium aestuarii TaxID=3149227 RepID=UPI0032B499D9